VFLIFLRDTHNHNRVVDTVDKMNAFSPLGKNGGAVFGCLGYRRSAAIPGKVGDEQGGGKVNLHLE
jgi:hypothetical protein